MDEKAIYDRINELLADTNYTMEIREVSDVEEFLNEEESMNLEVYDEISDLYEQLLEEPEE